jgi:hypothetical protein
MKKSFGIIFPTLLCVCAIVYLVPKNAAGSEYTVQNTDFEFEWILSPDWHNARPFSQGRAWAQKEKDGPWTLFDTDGKIIKDNFSAKYIFLYENGLAVFVNENSMHGLVDLSGNIAIQDEFIKICGGYHEGLLNVKTGDGHGFLDLSGEWAIAPRFEDAAVFSEGSAPAKKDSMWGFIDRNGEWSIPPQFDEASPFSEGLALVKNDGKFGYIEKNGKRAIDFIFDNAGSFSKGAAVVCVGNLYGMINKRGKFLVEPIFEGIASSSSHTAGLVAFAECGKVGFFDTEGKLAIDFKYKFNSGLAVFADFENGLATVILDDSELRYAVIDKTGKIVFKLPPNTYLGLSNAFYGDYIVGWVNGRNCVFDKTGRIFDVTEYVSPEFAGKRFFIRAAADNVFNIYGEYFDKGGYFKITPRPATLVHSAVLGKRRAGGYIEATLLRCGSK